MLNCLVNIEHLFICFCLFHCTQNAADVSYGFIYFLVNWFLGILVSLYVIAVPAGVNKHFSFLKKNHKCADFSTLADPTAPTWVSLLHTGTFQLVIWASQVCNHALCRPAIFSWFPISKPLISFAFLTLNSFTAPINWKYFKSKYILKSHRGFKYLRTNTDLMLFYSFDLNIILHQTLILCM